ncbi:putative Protein crcB homolog [Mesorhizobium sp. STM 4661]|nr:putative Protein crcB homolog [Mesorhizobium sp. STM 4661]
MANAPFVHPLWSIFMIAMGIGGLWAFPERRKMSEKMRRHTSFRIVLPRSLDLGLHLGMSVILLLMGFLTLFGIVR